MAGKKLRERLALILLVLIVLPFSAFGSPAPRPHAIGGAPPPGRTIVLLAGSSKERLGTAAALFLKGGWDLVLLTNDGVLGGWSRPHQRNLYNVEKSEEALVGDGVP